jgi:ABC-type glycerol-3-phosphate transport system substrate-binding protein
MKSAPTGDFEYWQIPYPKGPGGKGLSSSTNMHIVSFAAQARNPDRAFEFIRWFCGTVELSARRLQMTNLISPLRAVYLTKEWQDQLKERPVLRTTLEIAVDEQDREVMPVRRDILAGKLDTKSGMQQAQQIADRLFAT